MSAKKKPVLNKNKQRRKNVSIGQLLGKIKEKISPKKKNFGGRTKTQKTPTAHIKANPEITVAESDKVNLPNTDSVCSDSPAMAFFYSDEKFITKFDDEQLLIDIRKKYPDFKSNDDEQAYKRQLIKVLEDE